MILTPQRKPGELFADYRVRRRAENKAVKDYLRGQLVWDSARSPAKRKQPKGRA